MPGALVWMQGHVGIYIGDGDVIECTAAWTGNVLVSKLGNLGYIGKYTRNWKGWGKLPFVDYVDYSEDNISTVNTTIVQAGEGYWQIANRLGMVGKVDEIIALNNNKPLYPGNTVLIPSNDNNSSNNTASPTAYDVFVSELKSVFGLSSSASLQEVYNKTPKLKNDNKYNKVTVVLQNI